MCVGIHVLSTCNADHMVVRVVPRIMDQDDLMSEAFASQCLADFDCLDTDRSGSLEPKELVPVLLERCAAHPFALTTEQCLPP